MSQFDTAVTQVDFDAQTSKAPGPNKIEVDKEDALVLVCVISTALTMLGKRDA